MLITLGLLLLLTPFPSFQTTTLDKRDAVGSNVTKANTVLTFSKPKTTAAPSKQSLNPTLKPNTVTVTILPTAGSNQKSETNAATTTKSKLSVAVVQTTPPSPAKAPKATDTNTNRNKHKVNQTASAKLLSLSEEKANKIKPEPTGVHQDQSTITKLFSDSHLKTSRNKLQQSHNQTTSSKSSLSSNEKNAEDRSNHNVPSILPSGSKPTKDRAAAGNQTVFDIPLTTGDEKSKDKLTPNVPSLPASGGKTSRGKTTASGNQTIAHHPKSDEKSEDKSTQSFPSLSTTSKTTKVKYTASTNQTTFDNSPPSGDKKPKDTSASNTLPLPTNGTKATKNKHKESGHQSVVGIHLQINDEKAKDKTGERAGELLNGALESGEVTIYPQGKEGRAVRVYCDMETDGGGWTVFQRRTNGKTDFYRTWSDYKAGFGNLSEEFWLGNELLHNLTSIGPVSLRVDLQSGNDTAYARYTNFSVASEGRNYTLTVSGYTGTAGDSMKYHNGRPFSTRDKEPDPLGIHCAKAYVGGWWYKNCYKVNLNGLYGMNSNNQGIVWIDWKGKDSSIPFSEMKFRPLTDM
uniref:Fibrinogen C-terminal domain-containing protein n=1 Tax=Xiphophorus couchianus TaxID=32473 RepID=A0A3B5KXH2_9TELE